MQIFFKFIFGILFIFAGINHFLNPKMYLKIMPPYIPWHSFMVYSSGILEIILGALLLIPATANFAAWGLIALLIAVFPANIHMAIHAGLYPSIPEWMLWARLPLQFGLMAWAWCYT